MKRHVLSATACMAVICLGAGAAPAGSIWAKASRRTKMILVDDTARHTGDVLTIVINERSVIENETTRDMKKSENRSATMDGTLDLANLISSVGHRIFDFPKLKFDSSAKSDFGGSANYDSERSVIDQITVVVQDVLPNGNLVVAGTRQRAVGGDRQVIHVSGIVRPSDIAFANTVNSDKVANFHIVYKHKGQENSFTKPGWLARILNFLNPF